MDYKKEMSRISGKTAETVGNAVLVKDFLPERRTGERFAGKIVLMPSVAMLCN